MSEPRLESALSLLAGAGDAPRFRADPVPDALLTRIIEGATRRCPARFDAPPWRFVVVVGREREALVSSVAEALARHWGLGPLGPRGLASDAVLSAPAFVLAFSTVPSSEAPEAFGVVAAAAQNVVLLAHAAGLATHRIFSPHVVPEALLDWVGGRLGPSLRGGELAAMLAVGYPDGAEEDPRSCAVEPVRWVGREGDLAEPETAPAGEGPARPAQVLRAQGGERVLVADAYRWSRELLAGHLAGAGYRVEMFSDGAALLARAARGEPDLYVISETLPDASGFELTRRLRGGGREAPIVITTARRDSAFRIAGLSAGIDYYLRRPVHPVELYTAARILLERRRLVVELQSTIGELRTAQGRLVQQAKMATLGQLVAGVAHEINTPLGAVVSNNDLFLRAFARLRAGLAGRALDGATERDLQAVESLSEVTRAACARITGIVRTLRDFARVEKERTPVDLNEALDSTLVLIAHVARPETTIVRDYGSLPLVECHQSQLNQVFMNLLVNACQAIDGAGTITIRTRGEGDGVSVTIADTGRGIPSEQLERIFEPGFTTKDAASGTGLGLMIAWQIVDAHGGRIEVASEVGRGTTFTVRVPVRGGGT